MTYKVVASDELEGHCCVNSSDIFNLEDLGVLSTLDDSSTQPCHLDDTRS